MVKNVVRKFGKRLASALGLKPATETPALTPKRVEARIYPPQDATVVTAPLSPKKVVRVSFASNEEKFFVTLK